MIAPEYRGQGIVARLGSEMVATYRQLGLGGLHLYALALHDLVQNQSQDAGAVVTGVLPAWFSSNASISGYDYPDTRIGAVTLFMPLAALPKRVCYLPAIYRQVLQQLYQRTWHGNVRELQNCIKRIVLLTVGGSVENSDLNELLDSSDDLPLTSSGATGFEDLFATPYNVAKAEIVKRFSTDYVHNLLTSYNGNVSNAAASCGLERQGLQRIMRRYNIISADYKKKK